MAKLAASPRDFKVSNWKTLILADSIQKLQKKIAVALRGNCEGVTCKSILAWLVFGHNLIVQKSNNYWKLLLLLLFWFSCFTPPSSHRPVGQNCSFIFFKYNYIPAMILFSREKLYLKITNCCVKILLFRYYIWFQGSPVPALFEKIAKTAIVILELKNSWELRSFCLNILWTRSADLKLENPNCCCFSCASLLLKAPSKF